MSWLKLNLDVVAADADEVGDLLLSLGALCVSMGPGSEDVVLEPAPGAAPLWRCTRISALLPLDADLAAVRANVESRMPFIVASGIGCGWCRVMSNLRRVFV